MESINPLESFGAEVHNNPDVQKTINHYKDIQKKLGELAFSKRESDNDQQDVESQIFLLRKEKRKVEDELKTYDVDVHNINLSKPEINN